MKDEAMPYREVVILLPLVFGFGVLAAWGVFYRWGSMPTAKQIDLAAWTQAIGSVLAILVAVAIQASQVREQVRRDARREVASARVAMAFSVHELDLALFNLLMFVNQHDQFGDDATRFVQGTIQFTRPSTGFREAIARSHEFPDYTAKLVRVFTEMNHVNAIASGYANAFEGRPIPPGFMVVLADRIRDFLAYGRPVVDELRRLIDDPQETDPYENLPPKMVK